MLVALFPSMGCGLFGNLRTSLRAHTFGARLPALQSALASKRDGGRVFAFVRLGHLNRTGGYIGNKLRELIGIAGAFRFWHAQMLA